MSKPKLELVSLIKEYDNGSVVAVDRIDLSITAGETVALLGSSGCGKSTTLNMIVGLEAPTAGDIQIDGKSVIGIPAGKRNVGLVFQDYAIFTAMTVRKNLAFGLSVRGESKEDINRAVDEVSELLGMRDLLDTRTTDLGGSELQRVAIGRTLVTKPEILLLDEPLSNLEAAARLAMRKELRRLQAEIGLTIIYVTHDQVEAFSLADRIAVMHAGKIVQVEKTTRICEQPDHLFVAGFLGSPPMNLIAGAIESRTDGKFFSRGDFLLRLMQQNTSCISDGPYTIGLKPESISIVDSQYAELKGKIMYIEPRGSDAIVTIDTPSVRLTVIEKSVNQSLRGAIVGLAIDPTSLTVFDHETNRRININQPGEQL